MNKYQRLIDTVRTKNQAEELMFAIDSIKESLYTKKSIRTVIRSSLTLEHSYALEEILASIKDKKDIQACLEEIKSKLAKMPTVELHVAYQVPHAHLDIISAWLEHALNQRVLLSLEIQENLIGGALIEFNGKYGDYSINSRLK